MQKFPREVRERRGKFWLYVKDFGGIAGDEPLDNYVDWLNASVERPWGPFDTREEAEFWLRPQWTESEIEAMKANRRAMVDYPAYKAYQRARNDLARGAVEAIAKASPEAL